MGMTLLFAILTKNDSFRSYGTFAYLLRLHIRNINMRRYIHVDMNYVGVFAHTLIIIMPGLNASGLQSKLLITPLSE